MGQHANICPLWMVSPRLFIILLSGILCVIKCFHNLRETAINNALHLQTLWAICCK